MDLKKLDQILSLLLVPFAYFLPLIFSQRKRSRKKLMIRPGGMGDLIILTLAMKENNIDVSDYDWVIEKRSEPWAKYLSLNYFCYDNTPLKTLLGLAGKYEIVYNSEQFFGLSQIYAKMCSTYEGTVKSFKSNRLNSISHINVPYNPNNSHEIVEFSRLLGVEKSITEFMNDSESVDLSENKYSVLWLAGTNSPSRTFDKNLYDEFINQDNAETIYIVSGPQEKNLANDLMKVLQTPDKNIQLFKGGFDDACNLLKDAEFLLSIDSSPVHIASYFKVPTKVIFTSGIAKKWHPLTNKSVIYANSGIECAPCVLFGQLPPCPYQYKCKSINFSTSIKVNNYH